MDRYRGVVPRALLECPRDTWRQRGRCGGRRKGTEEESQQVGLWTGRKESGLTRRFVGTSLGW